MEVSPARMEVEGRRRRRGLSKKLKARKRGQGYAEMGWKIQSSFIGHLPSLFTFIVLFKYPMGKGDRFHSSHYEDEALDAQKLKRLCPRPLLCIPHCCCNKLTGFKQHTFLQCWRSEIEKSRCQQVHVLSGGFERESLLLCLFQLLKASCSLWLVAPSSTLNASSVASSSHTSFLTLTPASLS